MNDAADNFERAADHYGGGDACAGSGRERRITTAGSAVFIVTALSAYGDRVFRWGTKHKHRLKPIALFAALILFCGGLFLSLRASPDILQRMRLGPLLVILLGVVPVGLAISAMDFQILARLSQVKVRFWPAVEVTIYTRAANMLPIPGSLAVRMAVLRERGATLRRSGGLMFLLTAIWGGVGFCFSAAWLAFQAPPVLAISFAFIGIAILASCCVAVRRFKLDPTLVSFSAGLRLGFIALDALVLMIAVRAIGVDAAYHQTAILVVSSFIASIVPAGLGVRETIVAFLAPIAGIDAATGFLAAAVVRFMGMGSLAMCSLMLVGLGRVRR